MEYNIRVSVKQKKIINTGYELFQTDYGQKLNIIADDLIVTGTTASLILSKADGTIVERTPTLKDGVYSYTLDADDTAVAGKLICNIKYYVEDTSRDSSATFLMNILQDRSGDIVDSQNYSDRIEKALKDVETALDTANEVLDSVDDIATDEATRVSNETARVSAETERATAETARATAEETRVANETARETAETARATAETSRASEYSEIVTACQTATTNANTASAKCDNVKIEENANNNGTTYKLDITDTEGTTITTPNLKGADGTGAGDMAKSVYDTNNKGLDIYDYADSKVATAVKKTDVVNNLTSTDTDKPLSAAMGKSINDKIGTVPENKSLQGQIDELSTSGGSDEAERTKRILLDGFSDGTKVFNADYTVATSTSSDDRTLVTTYTNNFTTATTVLKDAEGTTVATMVKTYTDNFKTATTTVTYA